MKKLFLAWHLLFEDKFLYSLDAPFVKILDLLVIGECMYCAVIRALLIGLGLGLSNWFGLILVAGAILLRLAEKRYIEGEM
jgi:hypothetical protein